MYIGVIIKTERRKSIMKRIIIIILSILLLLFNFGCNKVDEVYYRTPKGELVKVPTNQAKELLDALNNLELIEYDELNQEPLYGGLMYEFIIKTKEGDVALSTSEYGIIIYKGTYYIQSMFEEIFDISRNIYKGVHSEIFQEEGYTWYTLSGNKYNHGYNDWQKYNTNELFVDGNCKISEIASWYQDNVDEEMTVEELFIANNKTELNSVIEIIGKYTYTFKKVSDYENVYLMKCNGPTLE